MFRIHREQQKCASKSSLNICVVKITQGGGIAAPLSGQILSDVLSYLEVEKGNSDIIKEPQEVIVPEITGMTIKEAEKILKENDLNLETNAEIENRDNTAIIKNQIPKAGIRIYKGNSIYVDT